MRREQAGSRLGQASATGGEAGFLKRHVHQEELLEETMSLTSRLRSRRTISRTILGLLAASALFAAGAAASGQAQSQTRAIVYEGARVITGGGQVIENGAF